VVKSRRPEKSQKRREPANLQVAHTNIITSGLAVRRPVPLNETGRRRLNSNLLFHPSPKRNLPQKCYERYRPKGNPTPLAFLVFLLSDWWDACATSAAVGGGAPGPVLQERGTGRGCLPPHPAALEVTRPEPWNDRRNTRKTFSFPNETSTRQ